MDCHVPMAITEGLRRRGVQVVSAQEDGMREAEDEKLFKRAKEIGCVLFTQDEGLLAIATFGKGKDESLTGLFIPTNWDLAWVKSSRIWNCWQLAQTPMKFEIE